MTDGEGAACGQLMEIGEVAASNIAQSLGLPDSAIETIRQAIEDEVTAMSSHFALVIPDMQAQFEKQLAEASRTHRLLVWAIAGTFFTAGFLFRVIL